MLVNCFLIVKLLLEIDILSSLSSLLLIRRASNSSISLLIIAWFFLNLGSIGNINRFQIIEDGVVLASREHDIVEFILRVLESISFVIAT